MKINQNFKVFTFKTVNFAFSSVFEKKSEVFNVKSMDSITYLIPAELFFDYF